jgi:hypothetical protein
MSAPNWWGDWRPILTPHTGNLQPTDLLECTSIVGGLPVNTAITGAQIIAAASGGGATWGSITGTLSAQTDLQGALDNKVPYTGATADVNLGSHDLTATQGTFATGGSSDTLTVNHTSGSGKAITITKGGAGEGIYVNKTSGSGNAVTIVGDLEATTIKKTSGTSSQFLKADGSVDTNTYQPTLVSGTNIKTINGNSLLGSGDLTVGGSGLTVGTTAITSGTIGRVLFEGTGNVLQQSANLFWDNTNNRLGIGTSTPSSIIHSVGSVTASSAIARGNYFNNTLVAAANNDVLVGLDIQPTFTNGAFTGVENIPIRFVSQLNSAITKSILLKNIGTGAGSGVSIGFNNLNTNNLSHAFIKSYYTIASGMAMSFGTGGGAALTTEGTTALVLNANQTANFTAKVTANSGGFQANGVSANLLMSDNGTPVITRNGSTGIQFLKDAYWQTFSIFTNNSERMRVASTGNVLINTTTDAGFKLDVNGTARVQSKLSVGTPTAASAVMEVTSTTQGFLPPRMTTTQKNAIASPAAGLVVYDTTLNKLCVRTALAWEIITSL